MTFPAASTDILWKLILDAPRNGAENMAIDEKMLREAANGTELPVLRFYTWDPPAVSLGRFQDERTAVDRKACRRQGVDIVRRITGGRAVLHRHEMTYSIVSRTDNSLFPNDVLGTYRVIAGGLLAGLANLGIRAEMVSRSCENRALIGKRSNAPSCFASPSWYEIVVNGKKIIGSAQRRVPGAFLQHGSILIDHDPALDAAVIPGGSGGRVSCLAEEAGRVPPVAEVRAAFVKGFSQSLGIELMPDSDPAGKRP